MQRCRGVVLALAMLVPGCVQAIDGPVVHEADCSSDADFVTLGPVAGLEQASGVQGAQLSRDELTMVYSQISYGGTAAQPTDRFGDLYLAHRAHADDPFGEARALDEVSSAQDELTGSLSDDLLTLYFDRQVSDRRYQIFRATRRSPDGRFDEPAPLALGGDGSSDFEPFVTADGLFFGSTRRSPFASLYHAERRGLAYAAPEWLMTLSVLPATAYEMPVVSADGLTIYFAVLNDDHGTTRDIWMASRADTLQPFVRPHPVLSINTPARETPAWLSSDRCRLYFFTDRAGAVALWRAARRAS